MATYATEAELRDYCADGEVQVPGEAAAAERLLRRAERRVDGLIGPRTVDATTGLKYTPAALTTVQRTALSRATCAAAEHELMVGPGVLVGDDDYLAGGEVTLLRRASRLPAKALEELSGQGLVTYSGTVTTEAAA